ncbi:histidine kinase [Vagococcus sp. JNUCC 83]
MSKKSYRVWVYVILVIFLSLSLFGRLLWENKFGSVSRDAKGGVIEFTSKDLENNIYAINGEWSFYPNQLLTLDEMVLSANDYTPVPNNWGQQFKRSPIGYGTYHLKLFVPKHKKRYALHWVSIHSASKVFINNELLYETGHVGKSAKESAPKNIPKTVSFSKDEGQETIDLIIQVSNFNDTRSGGLVREILFGDATHMMDSMSISNSLELITLAILVLTVFLLFGLFVFVKPKKELFYVSLILLNFTILFMTGLGEKLLHHWVDIPYYINVKLVNSSILFISFLFLDLIKESFSHRYQSMIKKLIHVEIVSIIGCVLLPVEIVHSLSNIFIIFLVISLFMTFYIANKKVEKNVPTQTFFLIALGCLMLHLSWWFYTFLTGEVYIFYPFDLLTSIFCLMFTWLKHYENLYSQMEEMNANLIYAMDSKNNFLSRVAIKLRKPIKEIDNLISHIMIQSKDNHYPELEEELTLLEEANQDILVLVNNMVELSNSEFSLKNDFVEPLSISKKIDYCSSIVLKNEFYKEMTVVTDIDHSTDLIYGNVRHFVQLIFQLLFISKKLIPSGLLTFSSEKRDDSHISLRATFKDCFVSPKQIEIMNMSLHELMEDDTLFESMYGVEMSLLHSMTKLQGGTLYIEPLHNGIEMVFTFDQAHMLDVYGEESFEIIELDEPLLQEKEKIILVISSNIKQLMALKTMLENKETLVIVTNCTSDALSYIKKYNIDLVIVDTILDNETGFSFVNNIRKSHTIIQLPVLMIVSTSKYKVELNEVYRSGANDYIEKPIDAVELSARVKILIGMKQNIEQAIHFEASWLQAQIEPHFLFNTLNTIISLSDDDEDKMNEVFDAFMTLLHSKYHYDNEGIITLEEEIKLVKSYLLIEETRYGDKLKIDWQVEETLNLEKINIISLSIQPIVENAIKHGVLPKRGTGTLTIIIAKVNKSQVKVTIQDDGNGTDKSMSDFLKMRYQKLPVGIGLTNTYYRFKKIMKEELVFESIVGKGTKVSFYLDYE